MNTPPADAEDQKAVWGGQGGTAWVDSQALLDRLLQPMEQVITRAVADFSPSRVVDVGCGTGGTTVAAARAVGAGGGCVGVDVSEPMIEAARARPERDKVPASFICADAQSYAFQPASFDMIISRFGVMFFDDFVAAFENLHRAARPGGRLDMIVWRSAEENPFMTAAERAAAPLLPNLPPRRADGPGQFAFAHRGRMEKILRESGWTRIDIRALDFECSMSEVELEEYLARLGPVGRALAELDEEARSRLVRQIRPAFDPFVEAGEVRFTAACCIASARA